MRLLHLLTPTVLASSALAGPWFRRADTSSTAFPPAPTAPPGVAGQYCPNFGYSVRCSVDAECSSDQNMLLAQPIYPPRVAAPGNQAPADARCTRSASGAARSARTAMPVLGRVGLRIWAAALDRTAAAELSVASIRTVLLMRHAGSQRVRVTGVLRNSDDGSSSSSSDASASPTSASSSISVSTTPSSTSSASSAPSASNSAVPAGTYCGNFGFDQICSVTEECGTGYDCVPKEQNGTSTAGCSGVCRYTGTPIDLPTCPYNSDSIATCRNGGDCGPYSVCNKSGPINADRSACNGLCGSPNFGPCPRNNTDGSRSCSQDSQCGETQRCGPGTRGVPCSGTCIELPKCKTDADCNPDIYTSYGLCAPNRFCYSFSDCRNDRKSCPGGICGNNSPNATNYQDGYLNRTTPFVCIFNATSSSMSMSLPSSSGSSMSSMPSASSIHVTSSAKPTGETKPEPTSKSAVPASSGKAPAPTSQEGSHPASMSSDMTPAPTSGPTSDGSHPAPVSSDGSKPAPSSEHPKPAPSSDNSDNAPSSDGSKPTPSSTDKSNPKPTDKESPASSSWIAPEPSAAASHASAAAPSPSVSGLPKPVVPVMCMGLSDIADMLKDIKADIAQLKVDVAAIRVKTDQLDVSGKEEL